jgi:hypothetical protein
MGLFTASSAYSAFTLPSDAGAEMAGRTPKMALRAASDNAD